MPKKLRLYNALKLGYLRNEKKQKKRLKKFGYKLDEELTTRDHLVAFNPFSNKVLFVSNGTQVTSPNDLYTDIAGIGLGRLDDTSRFQRDQSAYLKAKQKYKDAPVKLVGHSLGGAIISQLDLKKGDSGVTYNAANLYQKKRDNVKNIRTAGDPFSALANDTRTLSNPASLVERLNPLQPHNLSNIRLEPIFI